MTNISVKEVKDRLSSGEDLHLIDVREAEENKAFNIGGILLPVGHIMSMQTDDIAEWQTEEVICYCRSGQRSMQAALMLESLGFTNVKNMTGGVIAWEAV